MKKRNKILCAALAAALAGQAVADDAAGVAELHETTLQLIDLLVEQGVLKREAADAMLAKARARAAEKAAQANPAAASEPGKKVVRVTYVPEQVKREIGEQVRQDVVAQARLERWGDVNAVPEWLDRIKFDGDFRLRGQGDLFADGNAPEAAFQAIGQNLSNSAADRQRERARLRLNINAVVSARADVGIRLATGNATDAVSTNQTLGTGFNKYSLLVDRAFLRLRPVEDVTLWGGRIPNPFFAASELVWDEDLNFEGAAASYAPGADDAAREFKPFLVGGAFALQEVERNAGVRAADKWLFALQGGAEWVPSTRARFKAGAGYYAYRNVAGVANPALGDTLYNATAPLARQKGNSLFNIDNDGNPATNLWALAADYRIANVSLLADFADFYPTHLIASFDWARNVGYDRAAIRARSGQDLKPEIDGYVARLTVGQPKIVEAYDWQAWVGYRYVERDAVLDAFSDSDFHLGGTNNKGYTVGGALGIYRNTWLSARWMSSDQISGLPLSIDVFQLDLNARF